MPVALPIHEFAVVAHPDDRTRTPMILFHGEWRRVPGGSRVAEREVIALIEADGYRPVFSGMHGHASEPLPTEPGVRVGSPMTWATGGRISYSEAVEAMMRDSIRMEEAGRVTDEAIRRLNQYYITTRGVSNGTISSDYSVTS